MDSGSLEELKDHFISKLGKVNSIMTLQASLQQSDPLPRTEIQQNMEAVWMLLDELSVIVTLMQNQITEQRKVLNDTETVKQDICHLLKNLQHTKANIPSHIPSVQPCIAPVEAVDIPVHQNMLTVQSSGNKDETAKKCNLKICPTIEYLKVEEFDQIPKYMKGRLTYQQFNTFIDEVNKVFISKYKILKRKKSTLNDAERKHYEAYKMQESHETVGVYFIVESDFKDWSSICMSKDTQKKLTIMRHCGRMYEIRSSGLVRYAIIEMY